MTKEKNQTAQPTRIELEAGGVTLAFDVDRKTYNDYLNSLFNVKNKVSAAHNFLVSVVADDSKQSLLDLLEECPGAELEMVGFITEEYSPDLNMSVKKPKR